MDTTSPTDVPGEDRSGRDAPSGSVDPHRAPEAFEVVASLDGERLDRIVALMTGWSRSDVAELVAAGEITVDGETAVKSVRVREGQRVAILGAPARPANPGPEELPLAVRFEDDDVIVVVKPAGMVVHPGAGHETGTLVSAVLARYPEVAEVGDPRRPGIVHRLDKETSGLLVVARNEASRGELVRQLTARRVGREYVALVWGVLDATRGVIDAPLGRSPNRPTRMAVRESGREARTHYEVQRTFEDPTCSLLRIRLETGRTHQIRVHLSAIRHPVVGDATYGGSRETLAIERPFLHATRLEFSHPGSGERVAFDEPLPEDLRAVLDELEGH